MTSSITSLEMRLRLTVDLCLEALSENTMSAEAAEEFYELIHSQFVELVDLQTPIEEHADVFDSDSGTEGIIYSEAGQKVCKLFFGSCENYGALRDKLESIYTSNPNRQRDAALNDFYKKVASQVKFKKAVENYKPWGSGAERITDTTQIKADFVATLQQIKSLLDCDDWENIDSDTALELLERIGEDFNEFVYQQTDIQTWNTATEDLGSQGVAELPAGQELIKEFFNGDNNEWYRLTEILINIVRNNKL